MRSSAFTALAFTAGYIDESTFVVWRIGASIRAPGPSHWITRHFRRRSASPLSLRNVAERPLALLQQFFCKYDCRTSMTL